MNRSQFGQIHLYAFLLPTKPPCWEAVRIFQCVITHLHALFYHWNLFYLRINKSWHEFSEEFNLQHETVWYKNMAIWVCLFYTICVFCTVRVWYVPYAYGMHHTRTVRFSVPYAYGMDIRVWYVPYAYYAFSQCLLALPSPSYNGLSLQAFLAE